MKNGTWGRGEKDKEENETVLYWPLKVIDLGSFCIVSFVKLLFFSLETSLTTSIRENNVVTVSL